MKTCDNCAWATYHSPRCGLCTGPTSPYSQWVETIPKGLPHFTNMTFRDTTVPAAVYAYCTFIRVNVHPDSVLADSALIETSFNGQKCGRTP